MKRFFNFFNRHRPDQSDDEILSRAESVIQTAIAVQEFDVLLQRITPVLIERMQLVSPDEGKALKKLEQAWGLQFIHFQLFAAFIRGFRSGEDGSRFSAADVEIAKELRFLSHNSENDIGLSCSHKINDYFCDAVWLFMKTDYPAARLAALTAGAVAQDNQRESLIAYLVDVAQDWRLRSPEVPSVADKLDALAAEISGEDWTLQDTIDLKGQLKSIEPEYFYCLAASDPSVFRARFPQIFEDHDVWFS